MAALIPVNTQLMLLLCLSLFSLQRRTFAEFQFVGLKLTVLRSTVIFFSRTISRTFLLPTQVLSWCFSLELFVQFHPVACCLNPSFARKKLKNWDLLHFKIKSPNVKRSLQSYKVSKCKLIHKKSRQLWH